MPLELAVRRLTFDSATAFGIYDRGLLQPGMAADLVVFDPDAVQPVAGDVVHDFPNKAGGCGSWPRGSTTPWSTARSSSRRGRIRGATRAACCTTRGITALTTVGASRRPRPAEEYAAALTAADPPSAAVGVWPLELGCRSRRPKGTAGPGPTPVPQ